ncbi:TMEM43 family protein [Trinickia acidisoli]|uniref:TMEM43 family protein n=1 Tax=Trinickia acidisoli TaxID=2767482 RepID=UPI001A8D0F27
MYNEVRLTSCGHLDMSFITTTSSRKFVLPGGGQSLPIWPISNRPNFDASWIFALCQSVNACIRRSCALASAVCVFSSSRMLPFLEDIVEAGVFLPTLMLTIPLTLVTIAVVWMAHRPVIGVALIISADSLLWLFSQLRGSHPVATR